MTSMVRVAVASDVNEAEEIQGILRAAGIDAEIAGGEDDSVIVSVPEESVEHAQDAIEAMVGHLRQRVADRRAAVAHRQANADRVAQPILESVALAL